MGMTREEAFTQGLSKYFSGIPCKRGHDSPRYVSNNNCVECQRMKMAEWRMIPENKDKLALNRQRWYENNTERWNEYQRIYHKNRRTK